MHKRRLRTSRQREAFQGCVIGINDGLISTLALLLGVAGAGSGTVAVRIAGLASLVAGACSLAASQYIASQTQAERRDRVPDERPSVEALDAHARPPMARKEVIDRATGSTSGTVVTEAPVAGPTALKQLSPLRYGSKAKERSSPIRTAFSTLWASGVGAIVPIAPWFFLTGVHAIVCSLVAAGIAAVIIGAILADESRSPWVLGALRQLGLVLLTAAVTFGIGRILQTIGAAGR
jgi:VIT1/CCC1 family predicted Fe2+/Mn2+ transporter